MIRPALRNRRFATPKTISARFPGIPAQGRIRTGDFCGGQTTSGSRVYTTATLRRNNRAARQNQANQQLVATVMRVSGP
jgi:hypothetical protein